MQLKPTRTVYTVGDFLAWQRGGILELKPVFQRREVWKSKAKSFLIDTVVRGLPIPIVFLRKTQNLKELRSQLEVVDGQQRLRTIFSYVSRDLLQDYDPARDHFTVSRSHNRELASKSFGELHPDTQEDILAYEISTHVFPPSTDDETILHIFARINSTGSNLNSQELRNAMWFGSFKTLVYDLAISQLPRWRRWGIFSEDDFARMNEVEAVSDFILAMMDGVQGKTKSKLDKLYAQYDDDLPGAKQIEARFQATMSRIERSIGRVLPLTRLRRSALFYSVFASIYDHVYGLGSDLTSRRRARPLPADLAERLEAVDQSIRSSGLPEKVQDAMDKATADTGRRVTRHQFLMKRLNLVAAR